MGGRLWPTSEMTDRVEGSGRGPATMRSSSAAPVPPKRVLLVAPDFPPFPIGGGARVCQQLATEYHRLGWEVTVISMNSSRVGGLARTIEVRDAGGRVIFLPMATRVETSGVSLLLVLPPSLPGLVRLLREFRRERWDAVHLHGNPAFLVDAVGLLCRMGSLPYVLTFHGVISDPARLGWLGGLLYRFLVTFERRIFDRARALTAVSEATLNEVWHVGFRARRMETIPIGAFLPPPETDTSRERSGTVLARFGLNPGNFALCLGAFIPRKGQDIMLSVFADLSARRALPESLQLAFAGFERDRAFSAELRRIVAAARLESRVRFLGEVTEAEKGVLLRGARWVIMPSRYEASPGLAFDAMALGCVLVAPDLPSFQEVIGEGANAVLFHAGDPTSLSQALTDLVREPGREQAIRAAALQRSRSFATWPDVARAYLELFSNPPTRSDRGISRSRRSRLRRRRPRE